MANANHKLPADNIRNRLIKAHVSTNPHYGKSPSKRSIDELFEAGVFFIDKPSGPTCHQIDAWIRDMLKTPKVGHAGTLDPLATGLLVICTGKMTKQINTYQGQVKEYTGTIVLGSTTP